MTAKSRYKRQEVPKGLAPFYVYGATETVCLLCRARGPNSNRLPSSIERLEVVAVGVAFARPGDEYSPELGEVISLGRALKNYRKPFKVYRGPGTNGNSTSIAGPASAYAITWAQSH